MTGYTPWDERDWRGAEELCLDALNGRALLGRGPASAGVYPETLFYDRVGPGPAGYAFGRSPSGPYSYGPGRNTYTPLGGSGPIDIDAILARMLEGYRILDELFNPRSVRTRPQTEAGNPRPETTQARSD